MSEKEAEGAAVRVDELGLPDCTDPASFACAFEAMTRARSDRSALRGRHRPSTPDDLGLPMDGSPEDFAKAFRALTSAIPTLPVRWGH